MDNNFFQIDSENLLIINSEPLSFKINNMSLKTIINLYEKGNKQINNLILIPGNKKINVWDKLSNLLGVIFIEPLKVTYQNILYNNEYVNLIEEKVYSTFQIDYSLEKLKVKNAKYVQTIDENIYEENYFDNKNIININKDGNIIIVNIDKEYLLNKNEILLNSTNSFNKKLLSKYFDEYFIYPSNKNDFYFYDSINRKNLFQNFNNLLSNKNIKIFKFTGPSGGGKSISLLYFSRTHQNIIYLNLKIIYKLFKESNVDEYLNIILYEFNRLEFGERHNEYKIAFEKIFKLYSDKSPWELLDNLSKFLHDKDIKITIIFDQYKDKYITNNNFKNIKSYLNSTFKLIICSSINNKEIGKLAVDSIIKNKGKIVFLTIDNQEDYFYYMNLCEKKNFEELFSDEKNSNLNEEYRLFNFEPKYIRLLSFNQKTKDEIKNHILEKMTEHYKSLGLDKEFYFFNIYSKIGKKNSYDFLSLYTIPLKYLNLILENESFSIEYKFPFIQNIIANELKEIDTKDYFKKKKYKDNELYANLKGDYFEFASINKINELKKSLFSEEIKYQITVKSIVEMEECDNINFNCQKKIIKLKKNDLLKKKIKQITNDLSHLKNYNSENIIYYLYEYLTKEKEKIETYLGNKRANQDEKKESKTLKKNEKNYKESQKNKVIDTLKNIRINEDEDKNDSENEKEINYISFDEDFKNGSILIKQKNLNGNTLDLGVLLGEKSNKTFIGFQMKFYGEKSHLKSPITKKSLKEKYKSILYKCYENYGITITNWHYIMCLYYNNEDYPYYNQNIVNSINKNGLQYIFYNPIENKFYDRNFNHLEKIKLNFKTNIDFISKANPYNCLVDTGFLEEYSFQTSDDSKIVIKNEETKLVNSIQNLIKKFLKFDVENVCKYHLVEKIHFPIPQNYFLFAFKTKKSILCYYNINNILKCVEINNQKVLNPCFIPCYLNIDKRDNELDIIFYVFKIKK